MAFSIRYTIKKRPGHLLDKFVKFPPIKRTLEATAALAGLPEIPSTFFRPLHEMNTSFAKISFQVGNFQL